MKIADDREGSSKEGLLINVGSELDHKRTSRSTTLIYLYCTISAIHKSTLDDLKGILRFPAI